MGCIIKRSFFPFAVLSLLAFAAFPASAQVSSVKSCTLVKDISVRIVVAGEGNNVTKIYSGSLLSDSVGTGEGEMNGAVASGNIKVRIQETGTMSVDADFGKGGGTADVSKLSLSAITKDWGIICLINTINTVVSWVSIIVLLLSTGLIVYAGFLWMVSGQNPQNQKKAGAFILAALVGFAIVILARMFPAVVSGILL